MNVSCIVCASDSSDPSAMALAFALTLADRERAELHVVHLADTAADRSTHVPFVVAPERATIHAVSGGDPVTAVVHYARRVRADLIIVGATLAAPGIDRRGRLAEVIARDAHCPTVIVPIAMLHRRDELPFRNILCPVDFSPGSVLAYERALKLTQEAGGTLTLLHVVDEFRNPRGGVRILRSDERQLRMAEARARLRLGIAEESLNWCHVGVHVSAGASDVHIVAEARRLGADLIAMGHTSRAGALSAPIGSIVGRVAAQVACPVLVLRAMSGSPGWDEAYDASDRHGAIDPAFPSLDPEDLSPVGLGGDQMRVEEPV
jgi:nucleotide-binding universal stress UspA family protein